MTTTRPEILAALENVARRVNDPHHYAYEIQRDLLNTPLIERGDNNFCSVYIGETQDVMSGGNRSYDGNLNKVRCDVFKVVYWGEHPTDCLVEDAILEGELDEDLEEAPEEYWAEGEAHLKDFVCDEVAERLGMDIEVVSPKSELYSENFGGWVVCVRSKDRYSIDLTAYDPIARVIAA